MSAKYRQVKAASETYLTLITAPASQQREVIGRSRESDSYPFQEEQNDNFWRQCSGSLAANIAEREAAYESPSSIYDVRGVESLMRQDFSLLRSVHQTEWNNKLLETLTRRCTINTRRQQPVKNTQSKAKRGKSFPSPTITVYEQRVE